MRGGSVTYKETRLRENVRYPLQSSRKLKRARVFRETMRLSNRNTTTVVETSTVVFVARNILNRSLVLASDLSSSRVFLSVLRILRENSIIVKDTSI